MLKSLEIYKIQYLRTSDHCSEMLVKVNMEQFSKLIPCCWQYTQITDDIKKSGTQGVVEYMLLMFSTVIYMYYSAVQTPRKMYYLCFINFVLKMQLKYC